MPYVKLQRRLYGFILLLLNIKCCVLILALLLDLVACTTVEAYRNVFVLNKVLKKQSIVLQIDLMVFSCFLDL